MCQLLALSEVFERKAVFANGGLSAFGPSRKRRCSYSICSIRKICMKKIANDYLAVIDSNFKYFVLDN
ncbi:MAG: hypothetical protein MSG78_08775 [Clostridiales bacterium]|nr:hypothetical protein [Clostridiales bacterium]